MVRSTGVHEPQRLPWFATQRTLAGLARPASQARDSSVARASRSRSLGRSFRSCLASRSSITATHSRSSARLIRAGISTTVRSPSR